MQKVALITGASRGLGQLLARFLAAQNFDLILTARGETALIAAAAELQHFPGKLTLLAGDVSDGTHQQQLTEAVAQHGRLDLLINNASILGPTPLPTLATYPPEALEQVLAVNVLAPLALIQRLLPWLKQAHGTVINLSSDAAVGGYAGWGGYGASKAALDLLSLTLAHELNEENVAVISVDPGDMRTQMHQEAFPGEDISDRPMPEVTLPFWAWLLAQPPLKVSGHRLQAQAEVWSIEEPTTEG